MPFWAPPRGQFLYSERGQKQTFFDPLSHLVHVVIEWLLMLPVLSHTNKRIKIEYTNTYKKRNKYWPPMKDWNLKERWDFINIFHSMYVLTYIKLAASRAEDVYYVHLMLAWIQNYLYTKMKWELFYQIFLLFIDNR